MLAMLMLLLAVVFFRSERKELNDIIPHIRQANPFWLFVAVLITGFNYLFQGGMYRHSFAAISFPLSWVHSIALYLKRNVLGVFLPAGGVSALAFSPPQLRKEGFTKLQINQASGLFGFAGLLTVFIAGFPVVLYIILYKGQFNNSWVGLLLLFLIIALLVTAIRSFRNKGYLFVYLNKKFPSFSSSLAALLSADVKGKEFSTAVLYSIGVELCGMLQIYVAMLALGLPASFGTAASTYILSVLVTIISPFLRGLGAVELTMVYILEKFGYSSAHALSITILYRIVEFWLPMLSGFLVFAWKGKSIFLRMAPAMLTFSLGLLNIVSGITPPIHTRMRLLHDYLPLTAIHASHLLVVFTGLFLILTSAFLLKGLRNAWTIALILSILSFVGHLGKALDYEEAIAAAITILVLLATFSQYRILGSNRWMRTGLKIAVLNFAAVLLFGVLCFYFIDVKHFGIDFTWKDSLLHTLKSFLLVEDNTLHPVTRFGHEFVWLIRSLGLITWAFFLFTLIKPGFIRVKSAANDREKASTLTDQYGSSSLDYFKLLEDKLLFFSDQYEGFLAYRVAAGFAIVLEEPVCAEEYKVGVLAEFDSYCRKMGLKPAFYRVDENSIPWFAKLGKKKLIIGQEAILDINTFSLEGKEKKSLRNGMNSLLNKGFTITVNQAPQSDDILAELKTVSDEWLAEFEMEELVFSQGKFDPAMLQQQPVITVRDSTGSLKAFLTIIPDFAEEECTYDLIRKTADAPGAAMDVLIIKLIEYAKENNKRYLNLGLVPMTGISQPDNTAEQVIKLASERIKRFHHYKGLREFKEKYATSWENKYLVYDNDFDLLLLPMALNAIMKP